jgi:membrane protease YdiL (CAAX protease family)
MDTSAAAAPTSLPYGLRAKLRGFGPIGILAIALVLLTGNIVGAALVLIWAHLSGTSWRELGLVAPRSWWKDVAAGIVGGVALKLLMKTVVMPLIGAGEINSTYHYLVGNMAALPAIFFTVIVGGGFGEETIWRGFLFERLGSILGRGRGVKVATVVIAATLFAAAHLYDLGLAGAEQALVTGLVFGALYARLGRLLPLMVAHAAFDVTAVLIIYFDAERWFATLLFR